MPDGDYLGATVRWWETWAGSEQSKHFISTDWSRLLMLLEIVDLFYREPSKELLGEIRLNEAKLGGTPEDRARLHWKLEAPPTPPSTKGMFDHLLPRPVE
jgi:hypothetical protein